MQQYRPEIDGLRAIAVLAICFFHLEWKFFTGGWLGVDVFFVLSGYLIGSILLKEMKQTGSISLSDFYLRRVRRIMPALLVCIACTLPVSLFFLNTPFFAEYIQSVLATLFSVSNIFFWQHAGYFALESQFVLLLHTWSLGVEEQFYLFIPAFFVLIASRPAEQQKKIWMALFLSALVSFLVCRYGRPLFSRDFLFYMLPTRMWELFIGIFVALFLYNRKIDTKKYIIEGASLVSFGFIVFAILYYGTPDSYFAERSLFITLATAILLIATSHKATVIKSLLSLSFLRFTGKISYSLYLWHWPVIVLKNITLLMYDMESGIYSDIAAFLLIFCLSAISWKFVETPFRTKVCWSSCLKPLSPVFAVIIVFVVFFWDQRPAVEYELSSAKRLPGVTLAEARKGQYYHLGPQGARPEFLLTGSSHAQVAGPGIVSLAEEYGIAGKSAARSSLHPLINFIDEECVPVYLHYIKEQQIKHIIMIMHWDMFYTPMQQWRKNHSVPPENRLAHYQKDVRDTLRLFTDLGCQVWILEQIPAFRKDPVLLANRAKKLYGEVREDITQNKQVRFIRKALSGVNLPGVHLLDPWPYLLEDDKWLSPLREGRFLYTNRDHLTDFGALTIKEVFRPVFDAIEAEKKKEEGRLKQGVSTAHSAVPEEKLQE